MKSIGYKLAIFLLLLTSMAIAQTPANFAGQWEFDRANSKPGRFDHKYDGTESMQITQNAATLSYLVLYRKAGNPDFKTTTETYYLDGKERIEKKSSHTTKTTAKWSADKKVLSVKILETEINKGVTKDYFTSYSFKLSDDGRTLFFEKYHKNDITGESTANMIYRKK
jgi:hypothetical protein